MEISKTEAKYLAFLQDVKRLCDEGGTFSFKKLCTEHKVSNQLAKNLKENGIIKNLNEHQYPVYIWNSVNPNIYMVRKIKDEINKKEKIRNKERYKNKHILYDTIKPKSKEIKLTPSQKRKANKIVEGYKLETHKIIQLRDNKGYSFPQIAKELNYSAPNVNNIYLAVNGSENHFNRLGTLRKKAVLSVKKEIEEKNIRENIKSFSKRYFKQKTKKEISILWGLIKIKY